MPLLLDLDNTILPTKSCYDYAIQALSLDWEDKSYGDKNQFFELYEKARHLTKKILVGSPSNRLRVIYFKKMIEQKFGSLDAQAIDRIFWLESRYNYHFHFQISEEKANRKEWELVFNRMMELDRRHRICFVTNENLRTQLYKCKIFFPENFRFRMICSEEVGIEKPDPSFFRYVLGQMEAQSKDCFLIGDSWEDDIQGALACSIPALHLIEMFGEPQITKSLGKPESELPPLFSSNHILSALEQADHWLREAS